MMNSYKYINVVEESTHQCVLTMDTLERFSENFTKPVLFRNMAPISPKLSSRAFFDEVDGNKTLQWRQKQGEASVSMRSEDGKTDYNYVSGKVGAGSEFLDDIFERKLDVYSHLGTVSAGYKDPYEWGKVAFLKVKDELFRSNWFQITNWTITGHMFLGNSNQEYGEPIRGAVGSDWHMFPTLNMFVMIAGTKKWMTRPPRTREQFDGDARMFSTSSGREAPGEEFDDYESVYVTPGDVLVNMPYEWHKVLNARGFSLGGAFRIIDADYITGLRNRPSILANLPDFDKDMTEDVLHLLTSFKYASLHPNRSQMMLNDAEHIYPILLKMVNKMKSPDTITEPQKYGIALVD